MIDRYLTVGFGVVAAVAIMWATFTGSRLDVAQAQRDQVKVEYQSFRDKVTQEAIAQEVALNQEFARQEKHLEDTRTAYQVSMDRLAALQRDARLRRPADAVCPGGQQVSSVPSASERTDEAAADTGPRSSGPVAEPEGTVIERCQETTVQCAWLQEWLRGRVQDGTISRLNRRSSSCSPSATGSGRTGTSGGECI